MASSRAASQSLKTSPSEEGSRNFLIIMAAIFIAIVPFERSHLLALLIGGGMYWLIMEAKWPERVRNKAPASKYVDPPCALSKNDPKKVVRQTSPHSHDTGSLSTPSPTLKAEGVPRKLPGEFQAEGAPWRKLPGKLRHPQTETGGPRTASPPLKAEGVPGKFRSDFREDGVPRKAASVFGQPPKSEPNPGAWDTAHVFNGTEREAQLEEIVEKLVPTKETEEIVTKIANCVQQRLQGLFGHSAQVTGFVAGCINCESSSYGVSVPDVNIVVNADPKILSKLPLHGKKNADKAALQACLDAVCRRGGFKWRRFYWRGREPSIVVLADTSLGFLDKTVAVSISINAVTPLYNAALMAECARFDSRAKQLILLVRRWAKDRGICHTFKDYLPPYAWTQLTIFFLQTGLDGSGGLLPPVETFEAFSKLSPYGGKIRSWQPSGDACRKSLVELFDAFFQFYAAEFNWQKFAVSVRLGKIAAPEVKLPLHILQADDKSRQVGPSIEDPFEVTHNFGDCMNAASFARTHQELVRANDLCKKGALLSELLEPWLDGEKPWQKNSSD